jgi:hypothetical protein
MAGIGGMHFLPYAWLHRTQLYATLAFSVAFGAFALQLWLGASAFPYILLFVAVVYGLLAPLVQRHAARLVTAAGPPGR